MPCGDRQDRYGGRAKAGKLVGDLGFDRGEFFLVEADAIHLVDDHRQLRNAEKMQQMNMPAGLIAHAFGSIDQQQGCVGLRRPGHHVAQQFGVARCVNQHDVARIGTQTHLAGIECNSLVAFGLQRVEYE